MNARMLRTVLRGVLVVVCGLALTLAWAADQPLRVYSSGAPGASVYVTPQARMSVDASSNSDVGIGAFEGSFLRGKTPLQVDLRPGQYLVSVMPAPDYSMRDAMMKAHEFVWDGYDYCAIVNQPNYRWRYAQCYLVEKKKDLAAEVLAVFTDRMPDGEALVFDLGPQAMRFTGQAEAAMQQLEAAHVPLAHQDAAFAALQTGKKVIIRDGSDRWVVTAEAPEKLRVVGARSSGAWAGHRLSVCNGMSNVF